MNTREVLKDSDRRPTYMVVYKNLRRSFATFKEAREDLCKTGCYGVIVKWAPWLVWSSDDDVECEHPLHEEEEENTL